MCDETGNLAASNVSASGFTAMWDYEGIRMPLIGQRPLQASVPFYRVRQGVNIEYS